MMSRPYDCFNPAPYEPADRDALLAELNTWVARCRPDIQKIHEPYNRCTICGRLEVIYKFRSYRMRDIFVPEEACRICGSKLSLDRPNAVYQRRPEPEDDDSGQKINLHDIRAAMW